MDPRTQERVEQWDSRPFSGGYDGLSDLADADFSGAVTGAGTWLFMLNGRVVGVFDGTIEDFEHASGTVYEAPDPALPLLCTMEERGGDTRANYYTNETPLREVDGTLQDGSFTGYIELSENVLSGDYYAVYYGGRRMAAAYIGSAGRLETGEEAFERAADEVGIYEVIDVDIDVTDVPGADGGAAGSAGGTGTDTSTGTDTAGASTAAADPEPELESVSGSDSGPTTTAETDDESAASAIDDVTIDLSESPDEDDASSDDATAGTGIGDVTIDGTGTSATEEPTVDEPSGITATDEAEPDPPASGITDTQRSDEGEETAPVDAGADVDADARPADAASATDVLEETGLEDETSTGSGPVDEAEPTKSARSESTPAGEPAGSPNGNDRASGTDPEREGGPEPAPETGTETDTSEISETSGSGPDPAEVEAAAQQLEESDISWTEEDVPAETDESADDAGATSTAGGAVQTTGSASGSSGPKAASASGESEPTTDDPTPEEGEERFEEEAQWRETRNIPSIDPDNSESATETSSRAADAEQGGRTDRAGRRQAETASAAGTTGAGARETTSQSQSRPSGQSADESANASRQQSAGGRQGQGQGQSQNARTQAQTQRQQAQSRAQSQSRQSAGTDAGRDASVQSSSRTEDSADGESERVAELEERIETLEEQRDKLRSKAEELAADRDRLQSENEELSSTVERLQSRIEELEGELKRAREADTADDADATPAASTQLSPQRALAETNLFVRYASKSQPTLESARDGAADRSEVAGNLRLEHHTGFDAADVAVDGQPYEAFLSETMEYRFVDWLVGQVLFEIRDTGNADALGDLYDAIPRIDRAELGATISLEDDDTEDVPDQVNFDVVAFDKMGNPLVVANLNDSREPASQAMLEELEADASAVKANYPDLAAAVVVTSSYFEPGALEVAEEATSGGLLSRGSKLSYVNLSRKQGYHLCLVESRSEGFHVNVPDL